MRVFKLTAHYGQAAILTVYTQTNRAASFAETAAVAAEIFPHASLVLTEPVSDMPANVMAYMPILTACAA